VIVDDLENVDGILNISRTKTRERPRRLFLSFAWRVLAPRERRTLPARLLRPFWHHLRQVANGEATEREREVIEGHETNLRIGRSAARCIRLFPPINPSGFAEGHVTVANDRSVYGDDDDEEDVVVVVVSRRTARA